MEKQGLHFNFWAGFYLLAAIIYLFLAYTEVTGLWVTEPEEKTVDAAPGVQRVPVEQPEAEGKDDE
jgi:hypothetical protein